MKSVGITPLILAASVLAIPGQAFAQSSTPAAAAFAGRDEAVCTAEPREIDELLPLWFDEAGNPAATPTMAMAVEASALPQGEPIDEATLAEIEQTTREWAICFIVTGQYARGFGFMTDEMAAMFGPDVTSAEEDSPEEVRALLEGQLAGTPIPGDEPMGAMPELTGPDGARMLAEDRAGAIWAMEGDQVFLEYERHGDRWLIANLIDLREDMATPAA